MKIKNIDEFEAADEFEKQSQKQLKKLQLKQVKHKKNEHFLKHFFHAYFKTFFTQISNVCMINTCFMKLAQLEKTGSIGSSLISGEI